MVDNPKNGLATFKQRSSVETKFLPVIVEYLKKKPITVRVEVAGRELQIEDDIDLIWTHLTEDWEVETSIEIKFDTQGHSTGNFAFETLSNELRSSRGCFLRTRASLLYYYFVESAELYIFETGKVRSYFESELASRPRRYRLFETYTATPDGRFYAAFGRLVPIAEVVKALGRDVYFRDLSELQGNVLGRS